MQMYYDLLKTICLDLIDKVTNLIKIGLEGYFK